MMRVALLSNVTVDLLAGMLGKNAEIYVPAGYDTWQREMTDSSSGLYGSGPEAAAVLLHAEQYNNVWNDETKGGQLIGEWCSAFRAFAETLPGVPLFVSSVDICGMKCSYGAEKILSAHFEDLLIQKVQELHSEGHAVYILPVRELIADIGRKNFYYPKMWYLGSMPYSAKALAGISELILRYVSAAGGRRKKCIALDLDNTLWGGVIGEDGVNGILLSDHKEGARFKDTQRLLKKMKEQGVMLAVLSKNNPEDVMPVFDHPDMLIRREDIVASRIDWEPKYQNIRQLAEELNIGLDSFVFLDDDPAEREQMKAECPEVTVVEFPPDTSLLPYAVEKVYEDYFLSLDITGEDSRKTEMYIAENRRRAEREHSATPEDFLKNLGMSMDIRFMTAEDEQRTVQLINKTNQFNVTTKRYSQEDIRRLSEHESCDIITVRMSDKYGDQGLVAVMILEYERNEAVIDTFLMSCRVMGRCAELEIMAQVRGMLEKKGIGIIRASYIKTAKNAPVAELFEKLGFDAVDVSAERKMYRAEVSVLPQSSGVFKEVRCSL